MYDVQMYDLRGGQSSIQAKRTLKGAFFLPSYINFTSYILPSYINFTSYILPSYINFTSYIVPSYIYFTSYIVPSYIFLAIFRFLFAYMQKKL